MKPPAAGEWIHCGVLRNLWRHFMVYYAFLDYGSWLKNCLYYLCCSYIFKLVPRSQCPVLLTVVWPISLRKRFITLFLFITLIIIIVIITIIIIITILIYFIYFFIYQIWKLLDIFKLYYSHVIIPLFFIFSLFKHWKVTHLSVSLFSLQYSVWKLKFWSYFSS